MATYLGTHGTKVQDYTTDPANPIKGQVWYNETANTLKVEAVTTVGSWATGGNLNTGRSHFQGGGGEANTAALACGGLPATAKTEAYNGSSWTEVNDLNTARYGTSSGTFTSCLTTGGNGSLANTELWNGTNWTEVNDLNQGRFQLASAGADSTSALAFGGYTPPITYVALSETWNGTNWSEGNDMNTARYVLAGAGIATSALAYGGDSSPPGYTAETEAYNGTNWTEVNNLNTARFGTGSTNGSSNTSALASGGEVPGTGVTAVVEEWNGTNWTEVADLSVPRYAIGGAGTTSSAIAFGGDPTGTSTEEWTGAGAPQVRTISTD